MRRFVSVCVGVLLLAAPALASAHITLTYPTPRYAGDPQKDGPCGKLAPDPRGATATVFKPGQKVTVTWDETINHPGHFRIAFDDDGQDIFTDPDSFTDVAPRAGVLLDNIADKTGATPIKYSVDITLPNKECNNCTLQLIQVMTDKPPYTKGPTSDDIYYQCADIVLSNTLDAGTTSGGTDASTSSSGATSSGATSSGATSSGATSSGATSSGATSSGKTSTSGSSSPPPDDGGCNTGGASGGAVLPAAFAILFAIARRRKKA